MSAPQALDPVRRQAKNSCPAAVGSGDVLFVSGQVARRKDCSPEPRVARQVRLAFDNLAAALEAAGCTSDDAGDGPFPASDPPAGTESACSSALALAREAEQINIERRGRRLSEDHASREIAPLVGAVNAALGRLDEGYERQRRFIASAAHELRTPIAILRAKVDAAQEPGTRRLARDVERLGTLAEQLLDLQRLDTEPADVAVDLASLVRRVAGDLAPLLIADGQTVEVRVEHPTPVRGDAAAIERVVTNLLHNAVEHGGRQVVVRVLGSSFEVEDDGPGIPEEERERVFEPFRRLSSRPTGAGLGLHLVRQVVDRHAGHVSITSATAGGAVVRVSFPPA